MSRSNWLGSSGWATISDPTTVLTGRVLVANAGTTQYNEDYLLTLAGTTTAFNVDHYATVLDYAFPQNVSSSSFSSGILGLVSRAGNFSGTPSKPESCYIGRINRQNKSAEIIRRVSGVDTVLASSALPATTYTFGTLHTMRFNTYGTSSSGVNLQLIVDSETLVSVGDNSTSALTTGFAGIQSSSGTAYVDNFTILQYTEDGTAGYNGWLPSNSFTSRQLKLWLRSDVGITTSVSTGEITTWEDQSGNSFNVSSPAVGSGGASAITTPVELSNASVGVRFDHTSHRFMQRSYTADLDFNLEGTGVSAVYLVRMYKSTIGDLSSAGQDDMVCPVINNGFLYQYRFVDDPTPSAGASNDIKNFEVQNGVASVIGANTTMYTVSSYDIIIQVANGAGAPSGSRVAGATEYGFWRNGEQKNAVTQEPASTGRDDSPPIRLGKRADSAGTPVDEDFAYGSYDVVELQMYNLPLLGEDRQKVEGYLAWKYGLVANLPSDHPYKSAPPSA